MIIDKYMNNLIEMLPKVLLKMWTECIEIKEVKISKSHYKDLSIKGEVYDYLSANGIDPSKHMDIKETSFYITLRQEIKLDIKPHPSFIFFDDYNEAAQKYGPDSLHVRDRQFKADFSFISKDDYLGATIDFAKSIINDLVKNNFIRGQKLDIRINQREWSKQIELRVRQIYVYNNKQDLNDIDVDKYQYIPTPPQLPESIPNPDFIDYANTVEIRKLVEEANKEIELRYLTEPKVIEETIEAYDSSES